MLRLTAIGDAFERTGNDEQLLVDTFKKEFDKANNPDPVSNRKLMKQLLPLAKKKVIRDENGIPIVNYAIAAQHKRPSLFQLCKDAGVIMAPPEVASKREENPHRCGWPG